MLITEYVEIEITTFNKDYLRKKGYIFTKYGEKIKIKVEDLSPSSHKQVIVKCDCCGKIFHREYRQYLTRHTDEKDTCNKCARAKACATMQERYGGVGLASPSIKQRVRKTNLEKYGCEVPFQNEEVIEKIKATHQEKYGGLGMASPIVREKIEKTNIERYGVKRPCQNPEIIEKQKATCLQHYGVEHICQIPEVAEGVVKKAQETLHKRGKTPCSKMEEALVKILIDIYGEENCFPSYLVSPLTFDCLLIVNGDKIDVEYDGWFWHKDVQERDKKRNYKVLDLGYKILRVKSKTSLPTHEQIKSAIQFLTEEHHHYTEIVLDL